MLLNCTLQNGENGKFYGMCILPQLKGEKKERNNLQNSQSKVIGYMIIMIRMTVTISYKTSRLKRNSTTIFKNCNLRV